MTGVSTGLGLARQLKDTTENAYSAARRDQQAALRDQDPSRLVVKPASEVEWISSPDTGPGQQRGLRDAGGVLPPTGTLTSWLHSWLRL